MEPCMDDALLRILSTPPKKSNSAQGSPWIQLATKNGSGYTFYTCTICNLVAENKEPVVVSDVAQHNQDPYHLQRQMILLRGQEVACEKLRRASEMARKLEAARAPDSMRMRLSLYLFSPSLSSLVREDSILRKIEDDLKRYQKNEPLTLLELAVWKAACIARRKDDPASYYAAVEWWRRGWKVNKVVARRDSMIEIVLKNVVPFLVGAAVPCADAAA
jgi:hypothetical protein